MKVTFRAVTLEDWPWIVERMHLLLCEDMKGIVAVNEDNGLRVGAIVFDHWTHNSVFVHICIDNSMLLRHGFVEEGFEYGFVTADRGKMFAQIDSNNVKSIKICKHLGFREIATLKDSVMDGMDSIILELYREDCKYLSPAQREAA